MSNSQQCPSCHHENLPGADECDACGTPLPFAKRKNRTPLERQLLQAPIRMLEPRPPLAVSPSTPVSEVLSLLVAHSIGCVLVTEDGRIAGIFSERDALRRLGADVGSYASRPISELMTSPVETLQLDDQIAFALHKMDVGGYRHVPIMHQGRLYGVISVRDILRHLTDGILASELA